MKHLLARWLGYDKRLLELEAQRDFTRDLAIQYAEDVETMEQSLNQALSDQLDATRLIRGAHRQLNLKHSNRLGQDMILRAARILEGKGN